MILLPYFYEFAGGDAPLAALLGSGLALVLVWDRKDLLYTLHISLTCAMLVLTKDAGTLLALLLAFVYAADLLLHVQKNPLSAGTRGRTLILTLLPLVLLLGFLGLWKLELRMSGIHAAYQDPIDLSILKELILGRNQTYRQEVFLSYARGYLFDRGLEISHIGGKVSFFLLTVITVTLLYVGLRLFNQKHNRPVSENSWICAAYLVTALAFTVGLWFVYVFQYTEYEAVNLASFERYHSTPIMAGLLAALVLFLYSEPEKTKAGLSLELGLLCVLLFLAPAANLWTLVGRETVINTRMMRKEYDAITEQIEKTVPQDSPIYFISQEDGGTDRYIEKFNVRPRPVSSDWSIGTPFFEGDMWTKEKTLEQWKQELTEGYDYVAIYRPNDYFIETFGSLFADPSQIGENTLFSLNRETGLLELCQ